MCGICCIISTSPVSLHSLNTKLTSNLKKRGPDLASAIENEVLHSSSLLPLGITSDDVREHEESVCLQKSVLNRGDPNVNHSPSKWTDSRQAERNKPPHGQNLVSGEPSLSSELSDTLVLKHRGDQHGTFIKGENSHPNGTGNIYGTFVGNVLHLRGNPTPQPAVDAEGNILLWNGEIFDGYDLADSNDTQALLGALGATTSGVEVVGAMEKIRGPWSFIYWQKSISRLWFGRDFFGRRSLLWRVTWAMGAMTFDLSSVAHKMEHNVPQDQEWKEVPACGIFSIDIASSFSRASGNSPITMTWYPWQQASSPEETSSASSLSSAPPLGREQGCPDQTDASRSSVGHQSHPGNGARRIEFPRFGNVFRCKLGEMGLKNPIAPLNNSVPDGDGTSMTPTRDCDEENALQGKGPTMGTTDEEIQEKALKLIEILGEAVRRRVINVPRRHRNLRDIQTAGMTSPGVDDEGSKRTGASVGFDAKGYRPLDNIDIDREVSQESDIKHRKEDERTNHECENINGTRKGNGKSKTKGKNCGTLNDHNRSSLSLGIDGMGLDPGKSCSNGEDIAWRLCNRDVLAQDVNNSDDRITEESSTLSTDSAVGRGGRVCCPHCSTEAKQSSIGVLFSGGLDSIVLAALADRFVASSESIDLFNVAFEQRKVGTSNKRGKKKSCDQAAKSSPFDVPDRITGRAGLAELQELNPRRKWNFIEVDVTLEELQEARAERVGHLIYPQQTVLDDSIGCAIWFAARGRGRLITEDPTPMTDDRQPYTSPAKVVLVGMGADEQLAGYSRHRSKFNAEGWPGLLEEIRMEVDRISARNLGRDDRVISDHGRESRYPYLDEDVVSFLNGLPIHLKADLTLPRGVGEKLLLRMAAQRLGLGASAALPKRAIQFGSRIAKLENNKEKASDVCRRLEQQVLE